MSEIEGSSRGPVPEPAVVDVMFEEPDPVEVLARKKYEDKKADLLAEQWITAENLPPWEDVPLADALNEPPPEWVLPGVLPVGVVGLAGPSEAGKSLLSRDWSDAVANGTPWRGWQVREIGAVTYLMGEGRGGVPARFGHVVPDRISVAGPLMLTVPSEVDRFLKLKDGTGQRLVVVDMIYHCGVVDEDKSAQMFPLLRGASRIAEALGCCVLLLGHPGHNGARRFRGTSSLRGWFDAEYHMAENLFTCEKLKDGNEGLSTKATLEHPYVVSYPHLRWATGGNSVGDLAQRQARVREYLAAHPGASARSVGQALTAELLIGTRQIERIVSELRKPESD